MAAVLMATNGPPARGLWRCSARATSSLPVPLSPVTSTVTLLGLSRPMARNSPCIAGERPSSSAGAPSPGSAGSARRLSSSARRISSTAFVTSKGLDRYSKAPPWNEATALSRSP